MPKPLTCVLLRPGSAKRRFAGCAVFVDIEQKGLVPLLRLREATPSTRSKDKSGIEASLEPPM